MKYFDYCTGFKMIIENFLNLFNLKIRQDTESLNHKYLNIAASIQSITEDIMLKITKNAYNNYKINNLCLAGGVALNCVANGKILKDMTFENIWVQPAAGDAGGALGTAQYLYYHILNKERKNNSKNDSMKNCYLGHSYTNKNVKDTLKKIGANFKYLDNKTLIKETVTALKSQKIIGWFQGRMEFGPRALGNRSILADPRSNVMQKNLNIKIKFRESFRPFAPLVLEEKASSWFDLPVKSKYMSLVAQIKKDKLIKISKRSFLLNGLKKQYVKRSLIPAVTHVDNSARVQTLSKVDNKLMHRLISEFYKETSCPILVNTSFNLRGEPIVNKISDAFFCFMETNMDVLIINNYILYKKKQNKKLKKNYFKYLEKD